MEKEKLDITQNIKKWFHYIPISLVYLRLFLGFFILILAITLWQNGHILLSILLWIGLISDIFDGILARRWGVATEGLRFADARVDVIFWLCAMFCVWWIKPSEIYNHHIGVILLFCFEPISDIIHLIKFGRDGASHNWLSKGWGIILLITFSIILTGNSSGVWFDIMIIVGLISQIDRILIASLLPTSESDIPSFYHAYLRKKGKTFKRYKLFN